jgi:hypothetical protein
MKKRVLSPFVGLPNCEANDKQLIVPNKVKIDYSDDSIKCYCHDLKTVEQILHSTCEARISQDKNEGKIIFPNSLSTVAIKSKIDNFNKALKFVQGGNIEYIDTEEKQLKALLSLSGWLKGDLTVNNNQFYVNFYFEDYKINVSDNSAKKFCERTRKYPLSSVGSLNKYLNLKQNNGEIKYICFWKIIKDIDKLKNYTDFINECNDIIKVIYDRKKYRCEFNGGKVEFYIGNSANKMPKKAVVQINNINNESIEILQNLRYVFSFDTVNLVGKISNLDLNPRKLMNKLNFSKSRNFYIFSNSLKKFKAEYNINKQHLKIKQRIELHDSLSKKYFNEYTKSAKEWSNNIIKGKYKKEV